MFVVLTKGRDICIKVEFCNPLFSRAGKTAAAFEYPPKAGLPPTTEKSCIPARVSINEFILDREAEARL